MTRVTAGSAVQLPTFTKVKSALEKYQVFAPGSVLGSLCAASIGGIAVCTVMTPFDVVSTRLYNQPVDARGVGQIYTGIVDCALKILKTEGPLGYYKGLTASFLRLGPHTVLSLCFWQEMRKYYFKLQPPIAAQIS